MNTKYLINLDTLEVNEVPWLIDLVSEEGEKLFQVASLGTMESARILENEDKIEKSKLSNEEITTFMKEVDYDRF